MPPTREQSETLMWVRSRVENALDVHELFNESCDRLESGTRLTEGELELTGQLFRGLLQR